MECIDLRYLSDGRSIQPPRPQSFSTYDIHTHPHHAPRCKSDKFTDIIQHEIGEDSPILFGSNSQKLNTQLFEAVECQNIKEIVRLLANGANPNATCCLTRVSALHIAALNGGEALPLLLRAGATTDRFDNMGRTPLHLAAYSGNAKEIAILLNFSEDLQTRVSDKNMSSETEEKVKQLRSSFCKTANVVCDAGVTNLLPRTWMDSIGHACRDIVDKIPVIQQKWTPLHAASFSVHTHCVRLLLAAGADPDAKDLQGHIPLEVAGSAVYLGHVVDPEEFTNTVKLFIQTVSSKIKMHIRGVKSNSPLHTAVEVGSIEAIELLIEAGVSVIALNKDGMTPMHLCVQKELKEHLQLLTNHNYKHNRSAVDCRDKDGFTVLHAAVRSGWMPGIYIALEAGADIILVASNGQTSLHDAARLGNLDILKKIVEVAKIRNVLDCRNHWQESALFSAIRGGDLECVKKLVKDGASLKHTLKGNINILHIAAHKGNLDILRFLIDSNYTVTQHLINSQARSCRYYDFTPLHIAVFYGHMQCVKLLLANKADVRLGTMNSVFSTPLHIAAMKNNVDMANAILEFDKTTLNIANVCGWYPLHTACYYASRDCIRMFLEEGADMSLHTTKSKNETALSMLMSNMPKPTDFMVDIFDSCIKNVTPSRVIDINYSILTPNDGNAAQMKVIHALRNTGNRYDQKKLLLHPLVESFLYLKWKALLPFFYTTLILYSLFATALTVLIMSVFTYKDNKEDRPAWMDTIVWSYIVYVTVSLVVILEITYSLNRKCKTYLLHVETWAKYSSIILGIGLASEFAIVRSNGEWTRHLSTIAVLVSWLEMMFLLSRFPEWGYYFLMFGTVAAKILKILFTFVFLLIGFSLGFMIQFHSEKPFDNFWSAIVKTMVMMTSEFDYHDLFKDKNSKELATIILQAIFLIFIIMTAIVLMNLMVGVAVNDVQNLELIGNIKRIEKQIELLGSLESLVYSNILNKFLPKSLVSCLLTRRKARKYTRIQTGESVSYNRKIFPNRIADKIFDKALNIRKRMEEEVNSEKFQNIIDEIYNATVLKKERHEISCTNLLDPIKDRANVNIGIMTEDRKQSHVSYIEDDYRLQLNTKIEHINKEIDAIKYSLLRIEKFFEK